MLKYLIFLLSFLIILSLLINYFFIKIKNYFNNIIFIYNNSYAIKLYKLIIFKIINFQFYYQLFLFFLILLFFNLNFIFLTNLFILLLTYEYYQKAKDN